MSAIPVFSASKAVQCAAGNRATFAQLDISTNEIHGGLFDKDTGVFTVKTTGIYQFNFNGMGFNSSGSINCLVNLRVNDVITATSFTQYVAASGHLYGALAVSPLLKLNSGDRVDVFIQSGSLSEEFGVCTFFSAILISSQNNFPLE